MTKWLITAGLSLALLGAAAPSEAQHRSGGGGGTAGSRGGGVAVPRGSVVAPRGSVAVGRPFIRSPYFYGPRFSFGFYAGYPYYYPYYPYGYYGYYGYPYGYPYPYGGYAVGVGGGYGGYGGVRIKDAPEHAAVYADGYYVGVVDDFDGTFQHLDLTPGTHHIEIRPAGQPVISVEVNIQPGETITYHAR
jgi:hypothetical protein